ncbi:MAG: ROK family protein [bacterium]|nr:ROK family protein [bacterium]
MYLVADVGGTKTLVALMTKSGEIKQKIKYPTPKEYSDFVDEFTTRTKPIIKDVEMICLAIPGRIDREHGIGIAFGNLKWTDVEIDRDIEKSTGVKTIVENDSKVGGLAEAIEVLDIYKKTLYVAIGTGIGVALIQDGKIPKSLQGIEAGFMQFTRGGKNIEWEDFASGRAIKQRFGKEARDITDEKTWAIIGKDIGQGLIELIPVLQPEVIIIGGGIGTHFPKYKAALIKYLRRYETPMAPIPPIRQAKRPEEAVLVGCYYLIRQQDEKANNKS